jgi:type II secretory pathway pseudopilin PulG
MIEVLIVMVIIGILAAIAIPLYLGQRDRAKNAQAIEGGRTITIALLSYVAGQDGDDPWPAQCTKAVLVGAGVIADGDWPHNPFTNGLDMTPVAAPSVGDYQYREDPDSHATTGRHQILVYRKNADPFVIP